MSFIPVTSSKMTNNDKHKEYCKEYYQKHKKELQIKHKKYRDGHKEQIKAYRDAHKEEKKEYAKLRREEILAYRKHHRKANIDYYKVKDKEYNDLYKNRIKAYRQSHKKEHNLYRKKKRDNDIDYRIIENMRGRIRAVLKGKNKSDITLEILGCSSEELRKYLEKQFVGGMNWNNYGVYGWHIDHIKPCYNFDLTKETEQLKCFNYKNLRPLWACDNLSRGRR